MEGLAPFLLFLFFMIINIYTGQKRREPKKKQKQEFPDIYDNPPPRQNRKRNLDYMMAKPRGNNDNIEIVANDLQQEKINDLAQYIDKYEQDLQNRTNLQAKDFIQQTAIKALDKVNKILIDIEKEHIIKAITYAQVLEQPKSLQYLKRFGIKRVIHKD
ncbi:hypothetical protein [Megamonas funiformis]|uniref:hypothetical protein n=1 Tax=Megamonas funiformis TaxID=437897 RepID=UPI00243167BA|nr:hypothetical protein [Megamonas funiformis]